MILEQKGLHSELPSCHSRLFCMIEQHCKREILSIKKILTIWQTVMLYYSIVYKQIIYNVSTVLRPHVIKIFTQSFIFNKLFSFTK